MAEPISAAPPSGLPEPPRGSYRVLVLGASTGAVHALKTLLPRLPADFTLPVLAAVHLAPDSDDALARLLDAVAAVRVKEADEGERIAAGTVYLAPANYHLLVEPDGTLALSADAPVNFSRPSVDVLFESAAASFGAQAIGVILTGAASDGADGLAAIQARGGYAIVQHPDDAEMAAMPNSALARCRPDALLTLAELPAMMKRLAAQAPKRHVTPRENDRR